MAAGQQADEDALDEDVLSDDHALHLEHRAFEELHVGVGETAGAVLLGPDPATVVRLGHAFSSTGRRACSASVASGSPRTPVAPEGSGRSAARPGTAGAPPASTR